MDRETGTASEWRHLRTKADIEALLDELGGFHDSCVHEVHVATGRNVNKSGTVMNLLGRHTIHLLIQSELEPTAVELRFSDVVAFHLAIPGGEGPICGAAMFEHDGLVYWATSEDFRPGSTDHETTWIAGPTVAWREVSDWLGPALRYRSPAAPA